MRIDYSGISLSNLNSGKMLDSVSSLRVMTIMRERKRQLVQIDLPERILSKKLDAYKFVDRLGVRRPRVISKRTRHDELPGEFSNFVIRPWNDRASQGGYAAFNEQHIRKIKTAETFSGRETLINHLRADLAAGTVKEDKWIVEELITDEGRALAAARELKFYCFYGRVAQVMEVTRDPVERFCFWNADGSPKDVGGLADRLFAGEGFTPAMLKTAERMSAKIPSPFMRIDFHATGSELVFCEFTPVSETVWEYDRETDRVLGDCYLEAEARLLEDLLKGKRFDTYNAFYKQYQASQMPVTEERPVAALA